MAKAKSLKTMDQLQLELVKLQALHHKTVERGQYGQAQALQTQIARKQGEILQASQIKVYHVYDGVGRLVSTLPESEAQALVDANWDWTLSLSK